jgi:hypothetical protein
MSFFTYFPTVDYYFGDEERPDRFRNIAVYAEVIDEIRNNVAFYQDYYIKEYERPDQVSFKFYKTPNYHWTFYLMNDNIRERGWPLTNREILDKAQKDYSLVTITTRSTLTDKMIPYQILTGSSSGATAYVEYRDLDLGQLHVEMTSTTSFIAGETITSLNADGELESITAFSIGSEYLSAHHYENAAGEYVDIDPLVGPGALLTEVTHLDRYITLNDELKTIRIIKPEQITQVAKAFREAIRN